MNDLNRLLGELQAEGFENGHVYRGVVSMDDTKHRYILDLRSKGILVVDPSFGRGGYYRWGEREYRPFLPNTLIGPVSDPILDEASNTFERIGIAWQRYCTPLSVKFILACSADSGDSP